MESRLSEILGNKELKAKQKVEELVQYIEQGEVQLADMVRWAGALKESDAANIMEALEYVTAKNKRYGIQEVFDFAVKHIEASSPRLKWESAKVVGNTVSVSMRNVDKALSRLLVNTEDTGTVVRWSAAYAIGEIYKLQLHELPGLRATIETILQREGKNSIKKIYQAALKAVGIDQ